MINPLNLLQTIGVGIAAVALAVGVEEIRLHNWRVDYAELDAKHETCKTNLTTARNNAAGLETGVNNQNAAIDANAAKGKAEADAAKKYAEDELHKSKVRQEAAKKLGHGPDALNAWIKGAVQ